MKVIILVNNRNVIFMKIPTISVCIRNILYVCKFNIISFMRVYRIIMCLITSSIIIWNLILFWILFWRNHMISIKGIYYMSLTLKTVKNSFETKSREIKCFNMMRLFSYNNKECLQERKIATYYSSNKTSFAMLVFY